MNHRLKTIILSALATCSAFLAVVYTSCNRDKCKTIECANGGVCNGGACICASGFQGSNCETTSRDKFKGNWTVFEKGSTTDSSQYTINIQAGKNPTDVLIYNFYNFFTTPISGYVNNDTLYLPSQENGGKVIFGQGYITSDPSTYGEYGRITMAYEIVDKTASTVNDFGYYAPDGSMTSIWNK